MESSIGVLRDRVTHEPTPDTNGAIIGAEWNVTGGEGIFRLEDQHNLNRLIFQPSDQKFREPPDEATLFESTRANIFRQSCLEAHLMLQRK